MADFAIPAPADVYNDPRRLGDFHVIQMAGMFHVVFQPDADPQWFRIVATFHTYKRAYHYCDIERVMTWDMDSNTTDEIGTEPPKALEQRLEDQHEDAGVAEMVRDIYTQGGGDVPPPHPIDDFTEHPQEMEPPEAFKQRTENLTCEGCGSSRSPGSARLCRSCYTKASQPSVEITLTEKQTAVLQFFTSHANPQKLVNASVKQIAREAGVSPGSMGFLLESLERKRLIEVVERGSPNSTGVFRVVAPSC